MENVVNVLNHNPLDVLQLVVYCVDVSSSICQRLFRFLYVNVKLDELIRARNGVDLSPVVIVEFLGEILKVVEGDPFGEHFIAQDQIANFIFDKVTTNIQRCHQNDES